MAIEPGSQTWRAVEAHAKAQILEAQKRLEGRTMSHDDTMFERGRIIGLRAILAMAEPPVALDPLDY